MKKIVLFTPIQMEIGTKTPALSVDKISFSVNINHILIFQIIKNCPATNFNKSQPPPENPYIPIRSEAGTHDNKPNHRPNMTFS